MREACGGRTGKREANGGCRGELLKMGCQNNENKWQWSLLRWRGELHLWSVFEGDLLCHCNQVLGLKDRGGGVGGWGGGGGSLARMATEW